MKKGIAKYTAFCLAAGLVISESGVVTMAAGPDMALVGVGTLHYEEKTEQTVQEEVPADDTAAEETADTAEETAETVTAAEETVETTNTDEAAEVAGGSDQAAAEEVPETYDTSMEGTTGFAQCEEYLNVRTSADAGSEVVGKIYPNGSLEILHVEPNGWYQVRSGNVEGYVSADYVATGDEASAIAASTGYTTAEVGAEVLNVRASATTDSDIIATVEGAQEIEVVEDQGDWVKVILDGEMYGYVSADYVYTSTEYATGETLEEEQARLDQQWLDYLAQQEAEAAAAEAAWLAEQEAAAAAAASYNDTSWSEPSYEDTSYTEPSYTDTSYTDTYTGGTDTASLEAQVAQLYQNYLDAQAAADAAVANGADEQTIIDTAAAAQAAYAAYLSVQTELDNAYAGITTSGTTEQTADDSYDDGSEDDGYEDDGYEDDGYEDDSYDDGSEDDGYIDGYEDDSYDDGSEDEYSEYDNVEEYSDDGASAEPAAVSSTGQAVADYACQFVGNPYVWGGASLTGGADCSGFTMAVMANFGVSLPHNAAAQSGYGTPVSLDALQPGDLLFYDGGGGIGHVAIYIGNGSVVHASNPTNGILISSYSYRTPCAARRMV